MVGAVSCLHGLWKGLSSGLDGGIEPVGQRGRDKDMGTKYAEAPEVDIYGGWKPRQVCWFGECDWTDFRYLKRSLSVHLELSPSLGSCCWFVVCPGWLYELFCVRGIEGR